MKIKLYNTEKLKFEEGKVYSKVGCDNKFICVRVAGELHLVDTAELFPIQKETTSYKLVGEAEKDTARTATNEISEIFKKDEITDVTEARRYLKFDNSPKLECTDRFDCRHITCSECPIDSKLDEDMLFETGKLSDGLLIQTANVFMCMRNYK